MSAVAWGFFGVIAVILLAQAVVCWAEIKEARLVEKGFAVVTVVSSCLSAYQGLAMESQLWLLATSFQVSEMRLKSRVRELGGAA